MTRNTQYTPQGTRLDQRSVDDLINQERKTVTEILLPEAPSRSVTNGLVNADGLNPADTDVLATALGAPARQVLRRAEELGPRTGWRDGYLSSTHGFCPPDPSAAPVALAMSAGRVWSDLCERMPAVVARGKMRESILAIPLVYGTEDVIPDTALWAATVCLGILASVWRYEEVNDGHEGISVTAPPGTFRNISGEADDEEQETKGIPRNIAIPLRQICTRMGRVLPHLTQYDVSVYNYKLRDPTSIHPYVARCENMDLRWPVFNDRGEAMFLLCMAETHGCFVDGVEVIARCQEQVMLRKKDGLLRELINMKRIVDQFVHVFQKISVNNNAGENFANPVEWGQRYAKFSAPLSPRVPALSGLALPVFLLMDAFMGRTKYDTFLGKEALHLRAWLPMNIRAFIAAVEYHYQVATFVKESNDPRLMGVWEGLVESYLGERGWMGTHRYKVYGFLEVVAKTGRSETNGNAGSSDNAGRPWEEVHKTLSESMRERMEPFRGKVTLQPHQLRGSFDECRFKARILSRSYVDSDPSRSTGMVTFGLEDSGITCQPGDRLAFMPLNSWSEVNKISAALGLDDLMQTPVPLSQSPEWSRFARHIKAISRSAAEPFLTVQDILRRGKIAPLSKDIVMMFHMTLRASSSTVLRVLGSEMWPVQGTLGDLLQLAVAEASPTIWDQAFDLSDLSWLPRLIPVETPRTYSISNFSNEMLPGTIDLTVARNEYKLASVLDAGQDSTVRYGVSSGCLNPDPCVADDMSDEEQYLIGISRPLNFQLPVTMTGPVAMFAGGSGIAPFRSFWQARVQSSVGRNLLFLGVQSRQKFSYENELRGYVQNGALELHTAFSRDTNGLVFDPASRDLLEKPMNPRYLDALIIEQGKTVCDMVISKSQGGLGGHLYICGSLAMYDTIMDGIRQAIYHNWTSTKESADTLLAKAFAERRFMLDIFMSPKPVSYSMPQIPLSKLSLNTGHRPGSRMWIGVHGSVYDITDFLPMHPGGTLIAQASAGLDASKTFDDLAHTSNPEVMSLLSKYFVGHLAPKPAFRSSEIGTLYDLWHKYLRNCVESLTTLFFEVNNIMSSAETWFQGGLLNMAGVRKLYQFQSRLMQNGFSTLFGTKLQELHLKLTFALVNSGAPDTRVPDVIGMITRAQASSLSATASNEIAQIGEFVCNSNNARFHEAGVLRYAQAVTELDVQFLEEIREDLCQGMDSFDVVESMDSPNDKHRLVALSGYLLSVLERVAQRLETFYSRLSRESIYQPGIEKNPARTRWNMLKRKIRDGSLFILARNTEFSRSTTASKPFRAARHTDQDIMFSQVVSQAQQAVDTTKPSASPQPIANAAPQRLADAHTARAIQSTKAPSSFEVHESINALKSMSTFMQSNVQAIKRLSQLPSDLSFEHIMAAYGRGFDVSSFFIALELSNQGSLDRAAVPADTASTYEWFHDKCDGVAIKS
ncbi:uncharacterized protein HMPREF1541_01909 [Cyphellophora europaea CBS 101466]|uniref:NADPH--hemoprotein reductase n=1 Tax=Cyphellophora europaea (strain CBS 101466) TaxID=1220924 RepID=W2S211_CYPE1|nr:uncharacterized protein HMPREF1541_01909 [Cyphellophora europaea CBS 101466]ETN42751.1 hypothetical protein HMPREF1541_01909 [Cyphellophora europaea CBS 101466]